MSDLTRSASSVPVDALGKTAWTRQAGVEISRGQALYLDSNGKFQLAVSTVGYTGNTGTVAFAGLAARDIPSGTFGECYGDGVEFFYADSGLTINTAIWASATAGKLGDARVGTTDDRPIAIVVSATNIVIVRGLPA